MRPFQIPASTSATWSGSCAGMEMWWIIVVDLPFRASPTIASRSDGYATISCARFGDRQPLGLETLYMKLDRFSDVALHLFQCLPSRDATGKIWHIGAPVL